MAQPELCRPICSQVLGSPSRPPTVEQSAGVRGLVRVVRACTGAWRPAGNLHQAEYSDGRAWPSSQGYLVVLVAASRLAIQHLAYTLPVLVPLCRSSHSEASLHQTNPTTYKANAPGNIHAQIKLCDRLSVHNQRNTVNQREASPFTSPIVVLVGSPLAIFCAG